MLVVEVRAEGLLNHLVLMAGDVGGFGAGAKHADQWCDVTFGGAGSRVVGTDQLARAASTDLKRG